MIIYLIKLFVYKKNLMLYNNIKFGNKCIFYMSTCCTSFENLGIKIKPSPYFASIIFESENHQEETIYIGMTYLKKDEITNYIYDWRAPISNLFYDYEVGKCAFEALEGIIKGSLKRKRQYKIENQQL